MGNRFRPPDSRVGQDEIHKEDMVKQDMITKFRLKKDAVEEDTVREDWIKEDMVKTVIKEDLIGKDSRWGNRLRPPVIVGQDEKGSMVIKKVYHAGIHKEDVVNKAGHEIKKLSDISAS